MQGYICAFSGATLWGLSSVCSAFLMSNYAVTPLQLTMIRLIVAAVLFGCLVAVKYREEAKSALTCIPFRGRLALFGVALFLCQCTYIIAIHYTNPGTATVMQSLNIVLVPLITWALRKAKLKMHEIIAAGLAFCAVVSIATQGTLATLSMPFWGLVWGLSCGFSETFYVMCPEGLFKKWNSAPITGIGMVIGAMIAIAVTFIYSIATADMSAFQFPQLDLMGWLAMGGVCILGTFIAFGLFLRGVATIGPIATSLLGAMEPLSSAILSALLLHTDFSGWDWAGLVLMLSTIVLVSLGARSASANVANAD